MPVVVSDTSPLRALAHLGRLDLLSALFGEVLVPPSDVAELEQPRPRFAPVAIRALSFVRVQAPSSRTMVDELRQVLGPGEAEAIALAVEVRADAILIDETAGRAVARQHGLFPVGVLGVLLRAKQRRLIHAVVPLVDRLQSELGFFISSALRADVLEQAGE